MLQLSTSLGRSKGCETKAPRHALLRPGRVCLRSLKVRAEKGAAPTNDANNLSSVIAAQNIEDEQVTALDRIANALNVPIGQAKSLAFKQRGLLKMTTDEIKNKIERVAELVEVPEDTARQIVAIQPGMLFDTDKQCETLKFGIRSICYELNANKEEVLDLILNNKSVLHGRELRLSVADMAHLAMLREKRGRIVG